MNLFKITHWLIEFYYFPTRYFLLSVYGFVVISMEAGKILEDQLKNKKKIISIRNTC